MSFGIMDIIVLAIILISTIIGIKLGFIEKLFRLIRKFAAFIISFFLAKPASVFLAKNSTIDDSISSKIVSWLVEKNELFSRTISPDNQVEVVEEALTALKLPNFMTSLLKDKIVKLLPEVTAETTVGNLFSEPLTSLIMIIISFVVLFIVSIIIIQILKKLFKALTKNRIIGGIDRLLGAILGFVEGALIVIIILFGLSFVINGSFLPEASEWLIKDMKLAEGEFGIAKWLYEQHLFMKLFKLIWK
ncbi:MAG: CvpA family protein [Bacilli bacterium]|jgi:uncharacterized membrane protein required for colicin V production